MWLMSDLIHLSPAPAPVDCSMTLPGSKSYTNRALIIAALAEGESTLNGISRSRDSEAMVDALKRFGVEISESGDTMRVRGRGRSLLPFRGEIDVGPAGTTMRFLTALSAIVPGSEVILRG